MLSKMSFLVVGLGLLLSQKLAGAIPEAFPGPQKVKFSYSDCSDGQAKIIDVSPHAVSNVGWKIPINVEFQADEDIEDGSFTLDTNWPDIPGSNASSDVPWKTAMLNCSGDASLGIECQIAGSYEEYKKKICGSQIPNQEWVCKLMYKFATGLGPTVNVDGFKFPVAAGSLDVNMDLKFTYPLGMGDVNLKELETKVVSKSETGETVFCMKVWQGAIQAGGVRPLTYQDCGDSQTHGKVVGLQPLFVKDGEKARVHAKVILGTAVNAASGTVHVESTMSIGDLASCSGDAAYPRSCPLHFMYNIKILPMWFIPIGTLKYRGVQFPIRKGPASVLVDLWLDPLIPSEMVCTTTRFKASTKSGKNFVCVDVHTNADSEFCQNFLGPIGAHAGIPQLANRAPLLMV
jgi:hypothetical protein